MVLENWPNDSDHWWAASIGELHRKRSDSTAEFFIRTDSIIRWKFVGKRSETTSSGTREECDKTWRFWKGMEEPSQVWHLLVIRFILNAVPFGTYLLRDNGCCFYSNKGLFMPWMGSFLIYSTFFTYTEFILTSQDFVCTKFTLYRTILLQCIRVFDNTESPYTRDLQENTAKSDSHIASAHTLWQDRWSWNNSSLYHRPQRQQKVLIGQWKSQKPLFFCFSTVANHIRGHYLARVPFDS